MHRFNPGDPFPALSGPSVRHGQVNLPDDIPEGNYAVIWAYRADW